MIVWANSTPCWAREKVLMYAAASTINAIKDIAETFEQKTGVNISISFASSSTLAKQIESGAPAHIFLSAHSKWMDYLEKKDMIESGTRLNLLGNRLVIVAPYGLFFPIKIHKDFNFSGAFKGKLAMGDPVHVPAGIYGKEALISLGWWNSVVSRVIAAMDVRSVLNFVERGEVKAGIVYLTDAKLSNKINIIGVFPEFTHSAISYPVALIKGANEGARSFFKYLLSAKIKTTFARYGFIVRGE